MKIWLDDIRPAPDGWVWCKTAEEAIAFFELDAFMENRHPDIAGVITDVSLDHDLGENVKTGYDVVKCIEELNINKGYAPPIMTIHSMNPVGRANIQRAIDAINKRG